jgi:hypothetical protein
MCTGILTKILKFIGVIWYHMIRSVLYHYKEGMGKFQLYLKLHVGATGKCLIMQCHQHRLP